MNGERLMHFVGVQAPVTHQFTGIEQHGNLVAVADPGRRIGIHIEYIDTGRGGGGQRGEFAEHFLAKAAPVA